MKGIYLGAYKDYFSEYNLDYNDIKKTSSHINIICDMLTVDLSNYDYIIASPPCNYYSKCNYRRETSEYAQKTKHLLPNILEKLGKCYYDKPFIVENVRNTKIMKKMNVFKICDLYNIYIYEYGRHTYFTNIFIDFYNIPQQYDFINYNNKKYSHLNLKGTRRLHDNTQGGFNVHNVLKYWIEVISKN